LFPNTKQVQVSTRNKPKWSGRQTTGCADNQCNLHN